MKFNLHANRIYLYMYMYISEMFGFHLNSPKWDWIRGSSGGYTEKNNAMAVNEPWWWGHGRVGVCQTSAQV